jgi:hypothetical protein
LKENLKNEKEKDGKQRSKMFPLKMFPLEISTNGKEKSKNFIHFSLSHKRRIEKHRVLAVEGPGGRAGLQSRRSSF